MRPALVFCTYILLGVAIASLCLAGGQLYLQRRLVSGKWVDGRLSRPAVSSAQAVASASAGPPAAADGPPATTSGPPATSSGQPPCGAAGGGAAPCKAPKPAAAKTRVQQARHQAPLPPPSLGKRESLGKVHLTTSRPAVRPRPTVRPRPPLPAKPTPPPEPDEPFQAVFAAYKRSQRQLCRNSKAVEVFEAANESGCSPERPGHFQILRDARVTFNRSVSRMAFNVDCDPGSGAGNKRGIPARPLDILDEQVPGYARGYFSILKDGGARNKTCDVMVEEPTILHVNPRTEVWTAIFHSLEELFAVLLAAEVLGRRPEDFRMLFLWGAAPTRGPLNGVIYTAGDVKRPEGMLRLLQLEDQLEPLPPNSTWSAWPKDPRLPGVKNGPLAPLLELWNRVFASGARFPRLQSLLPRTTSVCFRQVVLPPRACLGSLLTRSWRSGPHRYEPAAVGFMAHILRKFGFAPPKPSNATARSARLRVMVQVRDFRTAKNGRWFDPKELSRLTADLAARLDAVVQTDDFGSLSMHEQLTLALETDILIGIHGSALVHLMFLKPGSGVIELTRQRTPAGVRAQTMENTFVSLAKWAGMQYSFVLYQAPSAMASKRSIIFNRSQVVAAAKQMALNIRGGRSLRASRNAEP